MTELKLFENIKEAFETSTHNCNRFADALASIKWDSTYTADGEQYFELGGFTFTTPSLDPFNMPWECTAFFSDNSMLSFKKALRRFFYCANLQICYNVSGLSFRFSPYISIFLTLEYLPLRKGPRQFGEALFFFLVMIY